MAVVFRPAAGYLEYQRLHSEALALAAKYRKAEMYLEEDRFMVKVAAAIRAVIEEEGTSTGDGS